MIQLADIVAALRSAGLLVRAPAVDATVKSVAEDSRSFSIFGMYYDFLACFRITVSHYV